MMSEWVGQAIDFADTDQAKLARALTGHLGRAIDRAAVNKMISGERTLKADEMLGIARITGYRLPKAYDSVVPVIGLVGASPDGNISYTESPGALGRVSLPPWGSLKTVALEVRGTSVRGFAENGWYVYYDKREAGVDSSLIGELCVVGLEDGRTLVKIPHLGSAPGLFHLESTNAPLIRDVRVVWASMVTACVPPSVARMVPDLE